MKLFRVPIATEIKAYNPELDGALWNTGFEPTFTKRESVFEREDLIADPVSVANDKNGEIPEWAANWGKQGYMVFELPENDRGYTLMAVNHKFVETM